MILSGMTYYTLMIESNLNPFTKPIKLFILILKWTLSTACSPLTFQPLSTWKRSTMSVSMRHRCQVLSLTTPGALCTQSPTPTTTVLLTNDDYTWHTSTFYGGRGIAIFVLVWFLSSVCCCPFLFFLSRCCCKFNMLSFYLCLRNYSVFLILAENLVSGLDTSQPPSSPPPPSLSLFWALPSPLPPPHPNLSLSLCDWFSFSILSALFQWCN